MPALIQDLQLGLNLLRVLVNGTMAYKGNGHCWISASVALPQGSDALKVQAIAWNGAVMAQSAISVTATPTAVVKAARLP